jgi:hypothetical protein
MTADIIDLAGRRPQPEPEHKPLKPETVAEHISVLAIGAADLALEGRYLRAAAMLQIAADMAFAEAHARKPQRRRRQPTKPKQ